MDCPPGHAGKVNMITHCCQNGCPGHLGKYRNCLEEAIDAIILNGGYMELDSNERHGGSVALWFTPDRFPYELEDGPTVSIPAGWYVVTEQSCGFVTVDQLDTEQDARLLYRARAKDIGADL